MPANTILINDSLQYTLGDSFAEPLVMFLDRYCYENMPDGDDERDTIFAEFVRAWAKAHYGDDFVFDTCVIKMDVEQDVHTVTWSPNAMSAEQYGDLMRAFEPPVDVDTYDRIVENENGG
jgi:hypothetical protein